MKLIVKKTYVPARIIEGEELLIGGDGTLEVRVLSDGEVSLALVDADAGLVVAHVAIADLRRALDGV